MDNITKKFIHYSNDSFGEPVVQIHKLILEDNDQRSNGFEKDCTVNISIDLVRKYGFDKPEVVDALRGKVITLTGFVHDQDKGYLDKSGNPRTRTALKFAVEDIAIDSKK